MKEHRHNKEKKKKKGEFKKQQKKHQNMQHNRDQLKLLKDGEIEEAELFVLDPDAFKKVTIVLPDYSNKNYDYNRICQYGEPIVYLYHNGKGSKLRTGIISNKNGLRVDGEPGGHIDHDNVLGIVVKTETLKEKTQEEKEQSEQSYRKMTVAKYCLT